MDRKHLSVIHSSVMLFLSEKKNANNLHTENTRKKKNTL